MESQSPQRARRASQSDIAQRLGVSISTVSRALANEPGISEAVQIEVRRLARQIGYKAKHVAPGTANRRITALVPLGSATSGLSGFYFAITDGIKAQASDLGMAIDVRLANESSVTLGLIRRQVEQFDANGLLLAGIDPWDELVDWSREAQVPIVLVNGSDPLMRLSSVGPANFYGAYRATERLIAAGHRKILHYGRSHRPTLMQRRRGFEAAVAAHEGVDGIVVDNDRTTAKALLSDLAAGRYAATAIFAWNDIAALQMIEGFRDEETFGGAPLSVIGFDDLPIAGMATPRLSTVRVDREAIGRGAVRLLAQCFEGETAIQQLQVGVELVEGETVWPGPFA